MAIITVLDFISEIFVELVVATLILWLDRRNKMRERDRLKNRDKRDKEERERFNNFVHEISQHQVFLLESILQSLEPEKAENFKHNIQEKYSEEIESDIHELGELLSQKVESDIEDKDLENEIRNKMHEIEASRVISSSLFSDKIGESLNNITKSTKSVLDSLSLADLTNKNLIKEQVSSIIKSIEVETKNMLSEFKDIGNIKVDLKKIAKVEKNTKKSEKKIGTLDNIIKDLISGDIEKLKNLADKAKKEFIKKDKKEKEE